MVKAGLVYGCYMMNFHPVILGGKNDSAVIGQDFIIPCTLQTQACFDLDDTAPLKETKTNYFVRPDVSPVITVY